MPGKRKAGDMSSEEPQENLSKKAKLKLARERAAKFAQRDKEKLQSRKAQKYGAATPKASAPAKAAEATPPVKKSPDKKMSLSERKKLAMKNAKEFAARDRANLEAKKAAASPRVSSPKPPPAENLGAAIDPTQVQAYEQMRMMQDVMQKQQQQLVAQQQMLMQQNELQRKPPAKVTIAVDSDEERETEDDVPPPPPALMAQVSQQVLLNAQKNVVIDSSEEEEEKQVDAEEAENANEIDPLISAESSDIPNPEAISESDQPVEATKPKSRWLQKLLLVLAVAAIAIFFVMVPVPLTEVTTSLDEPVVPEETHCYFNSEPEYEGEGCENDNSGIPCPNGGVCEAGKLTACDNIFQDVSNQGTKCVLGEEHIAMKEVLTSQLLSLSSQICDHSSKPSFKYSMLQKYEPEILPEESDDLADALAGEGFVVHERDGLYVGLPEDVNVSLPFYCVLGNVGQWLLQEVGLLLLGLVRFASSNLLGFVSTYPKPSAVMFVLFVLLSKIRRYRAAKKKLQEDVIQTRKIAYKTLEESCGVEHCATHIRDEIAMALYPDSKKLRLELAKKVWPKVVDDVKRDTRVRKFQTLNRDGKTRDMWQWTAASKTSSQS